MNFIEKTKLSYNLDQVRRDYESLIKDLPYQTDQICLTSSSLCRDRLHDCTGTPYAEDKRQGDEDGFRIFNEEFRGTIFEQIYNDCQQAFGQRVRRTRLMRMMPFKSIGIHRDRPSDEMRLHLAIHSNPQAFLFTVKEKGQFEDMYGFHVPEDGFLYQMDAQRLHCAVNASSKPRVHLVINIVKEAK